MKSRPCIWMSAACLAVALTMAIQLLAQDNAPNNHQPRYRVVDIGTLGGPQSMTFGLTGSLNAPGTFVANADTSTPDPNPNVNLYFSSYDGYFRHAVRLQRGIVTDLGTLPNGGSSGAQYVNNLGQVVGASMNGQVDPLVGVWEVHAALWSDARIRDLGTLGGNESVAYSLNSSGQVTGGALNTVPDPYVPFFLLSGATQMHTFLWQDGHMRDLGTLGGPDSIAYNINESGQVAGESFTNSTPNPTTGVPTLDAFIWAQGRMHDLGTLGGTLSFESWLNNRGQVVGQSNLAGDQTWHPFLWDGGVLRDLGTFGGSYGSANWINDDGEVVGYAYVQGDQSAHPFLWTNGRMTDLGLPAGATCANATSINSQGQIVGVSGTCATDGGGFLWENGGPTIDLNSLIPPGSGVQIVAAQNINDNGEIACDGILPNGDIHAVLLVPCDQHDPGGCRNQSLATEESTNNPPLSQQPVKSGRDPLTHFHSPTYPR
jgi:probable HAF family extracellular repeat protein